MTTGNGSESRFMTDAEVRSVMQAGLGKLDVAGKRVLIIIPDGTRSGPIDLFFRLFHELLADQAAALDYLIALGTHQPMTEEAIHRHLGVTAEEMATTYTNVHVFNHHWEKPETFATLGIIPASEIETLSGGLFSQDVPVRLNKMIFEYDQIIVCGPVFPHEVAGFSGGNKYFFPGISGSEVIDFTHWLGAVITNYKIIGTQSTPVRDVINRAAAMIDMPVFAVCFVVLGDNVVGVFPGEMNEVWPQAVELSSQTHIKWVDRSYKQVLSVMPDLYDDIWTGAKGMYKMEPVIADGGEVIIYAPHISEISYSHGRILDEVGYHVRDYFLKQWDRFSDKPWGVLAHSTHLKGMGAYENGVERPRVQVTLATQISPERCAQVALGYRDPATINPEDWANREDEGILLVPHAGEMLYRMKAEPD
ncbi:MAG: DUF2088 domain-containing protein [Caldilineales bacterium]|nr:DUF2088 domain-containing protein [Caldilineales bacterium]